MIRRLATLVFAVLSMQCVGYSQGGTITVKKSADSLTRQMLEDKYYMGATSKSVILKLNGNSKFKLVYRKPGTKAVIGSWSIKDGRVILVRTGEGKYRDEEYSELIIEVNPGGIKLSSPSTESWFYNDFVKFKW